jgi:hypothetical protein
MLKGQMACQPAQCFHIPFDRLDTFNLLSPKINSLKGCIAMIFLFHQQGYAKAGVTTHKVFGDITVSQNFTLSRHC